MDKLCSNIDTCFKIDMIGDQEDGLLLTVKEYERVSGIKGDNLGYRFSIPILKAQLAKAEKHYKQKISPYA